MEQYPQSKGSRELLRVQYDKKKQGHVHRKLEVMEHVAGENNQQLVCGDFYAMINLRNLHFIETFRK